MSLSENHPAPENYAEMFNYYTDAPIKELLVAETFEPYQ
jgi:hypothetical protein